MGEECVVLWVYGQDLIADPSAETFPEVPTSIPTCRIDRDLLFFIYCRYLALEEVLPSI